MGQAPSGTAYNDEGEGWPLIAGAGDFGDGVPAAKKFTREATKISRVGDIVLGIRASIGEKVLADDEYCLGRGVAALRPTEAIMPRFLWHWIDSAKDRLVSKAKGATFKQVNREDISEMEVPLPPLPEQRRIAAILDQADALRAKRRQALAELNTLTQSIFLEMFGDPAANPKNWQQKALAEVSVFENGDRSGNYPSGDDIKRSGVLFLSTKNIVGDELDLADLRFISKEKFSSLSRGKPLRGDVLITLRGTLGSCAVFDCEHETAFINAQMMVIRLRSRGSPIFLHALLTSPWAKAHFERIGRGAAVRQLTASQLAEMSVIWPPESIQHAFEALCSQLKSVLRSLNESAAKLDALFNAIQKRAFRGEL